MRIAAVAILFVAGVSLLSAAGVRADRLFGTASLQYEHLSREQVVVTSQEGDIDTTVATVDDNLTRESLILTYEDALFTKNRLRLTANLQRREFPSLDYHEFQPTYYLVLTSYGYDINLRYSPYTRRVLSAGINEAVEVEYDDWRLTTTFTYDDYPSLSLIYSYLRNRDNQGGTLFDGRNRNIVLESSYDIGPVNARASYSNLDRESNRSGGIEAVTETWSGTTGLSRTLGDFGFVSASYNFYDTRQETFGVRTQNSETHSVTSLFSLTPINAVSASVSYSGRFTNARLREIENDSRSQNILGRVEYQPTSYLTAFFGKAYQIDEQPTDDNIVEYINLGATATRYLRSGVDTRATFSRTIFQQSERLVPVADTAGATDGFVEDGEYIVDTYSASIDFKPRPFLRTLFDFSVTHNLDPIDEDRRYQTTASVDARFYVVKDLEGRFRFTTLNQGSTFDITRSYSENYNLGITYIPFSNFNLNLTYIYQDYNTSIRSETSTLSGYISYSFRRAFTLYVSYNRRSEKRVRSTEVDSGLSEFEASPRTLNGQLLMYLSRKATLSVAYYRNKPDNVSGLDITDESFQTILTLQI